MLFRSVISKHKDVVANLLKQLGWPRDMVDYHVNDGFAELRNVLLGIEQYQVPTEELIDAKSVQLDSGMVADREQKYQDYVQGKSDRFFRDDLSDPRKISAKDFLNLPAITISATENGMEIQDGAHRTFLAQKANAKLKAWVIRKGNNSGPVVQKIKQLFE